MASDGGPCLEGNEAEGESCANFDGTEAATGPCRAMYDIPLLSKDAGNCASSADRWCPMGERGMRESSVGEPYLEVGFEPGPTSIEGIPSYWRSL